MTDARARCRLRKVRRSVAGLCIYSLLLATSLESTAADVINDFDLSNLSVPRELVAHGGPPRDGIPALTDPAFISAKAADWLAPEQRVLGVHRNGVSKAYPLAIMTWHEIVNDRFGDEPVVVTYCPLCYTGMSFEAAIDGRRRQFGVSGLLYNNDVLMYDRETESLWSQILAESVGGKLKGQRLTAVPTANTTWGEWRKRHPDTLVLSRKTGHRRDYERNPYASYDISGEIIFPIRFRASGYHPKERVMGLEVQDKAIAFPFVELNASTFPLTLNFNGKPLKLLYDSETRTATIYDEDGKELPGVVAYWFAWYAFHPDTEVYKATLHQGVRGGDP